MTLVDESDSKVEMDQSLVKLFPNPAREYLSVTSSYPVSNYTVLNALGQIVVKGNIIDQRINVSTLQSGVYFLQLQVENEVLIKRFIKE